MGSRDLWARNRKSFLMQFEILGLDLHLAALSLSLIYFGNSGPSNTIDWLWIGPAKYFKVDFLI